MARQIWVDPPKTRIEQAAWSLRDKIMLGDLRPGERLIEQQISPILSVSRASLREALRMLEAERLVVWTPNCGYAVARFDAKAVRDLHDIWGMLTGRAVFAFAKKAAAEEFAELLELPGKMRSSADDRLQFLQLTNTLFNAILIRADNRALLDVVWSLVSRINSLRAGTLTPEVAKVWADDFEAMLRACMARDPARARALLCEHVAGACALALGPFDKAAIPPTRGLAATTRKSATAA